MKKLWIPVILILVMALILGACTSQTTTAPTSGAGHLRRQPPQRTADLSAPANSAHRPPQAPANLSTANCTRLLLSI